MAIAVATVVIASASAWQASGSALPHVRAVAPPAKSPVMAFSFFEELAENLKQFTDQRVGRASHIMLRGSEVAVAQLIEWKREIADDEELFAERARQSSACRSSAKGGDLGFVTRGKLTKQFDDVIFSEEPGYVYGPVTSEFGHHLIFLHSCREPSASSGLNLMNSRLRMATTTRSMQNGDVA
uniref:Peptidyl-prolyl cis-trans isomerase n=1 Tax=Chrysotila carterae TaxID=13221 RepID=A0A7S4B5F8_CHRCT